MLLLISHSHQSTCFFLSNWPTSARDRTNVAIPFHAKIYVALLLDRNRAIEMVLLGCKKLSSSCCCRDKSQLSNHLWYRFGSRRRFIKASVQSTSSTSRMIRRHAGWSLAVGLTTDFCWTSDSFQWDESPTGWYFTMFEQFFVDNWMRGCKQSRRRRRVPVFGEGNGLEWILSVCTKV